MSKWIDKRPTGTLKSDANTNIKNPSHTFRSCEFYRNALEGTKCLHGFFPLLYRLILSHHVIYFWYSIEVSPRKYFPNLRENVTAIPVTHGFSVWICGKWWGEGEVANLSFEVGGIRGGKLWGTIVLILNRYFFQSEIYVSRVCRWRKGLNCYVKE